MSSVDLSSLSDLSLEPSAMRALTSEQKERLTDILDAYLSALEQGVPPQPESLLTEHPDLAEPLQIYLAQLDQLHDAAAGFGGERSAPATELDGHDERRLGDFILGREIGRGGMGVVYEARQISLGRQVALKVLPFASVLDSKQITRFKNEAQAAAGLHHPNIVPVYAVGVERGVHYFAMQFIDGQPLDQAISELRKGRRKRPRPAVRAADSAAASAALWESVGQVAVEVALHSADNSVSDVCPSTARAILTEGSPRSPDYFRTVIGLGIQAAEALHASHEYGVVHRDVKPSNLLVDGNGKLWVTDFGLARCQTNTALTKTGELIGTMRYMSPEQATGQSALVDHRTDVYSLGATLYELLALQPAFPGEHDPELLRRIDQQEPPRLRQLRPELPADLELVIAKAMAKSRDERYATAWEFAQDLRCVLDGQPTLAKPPSIADRFSKWTRRHRRVVSVAAAICLLAVLGFATSTVLISRQKTIAEQNAKRAEQHFQDAHYLVNHLGDRLAERLSDVPGGEQIRRELLSEMLEYHRRFVARAADDPALRSDLAMNCSKIAALTEQIGSIDEAIDAHEEACRQYGQLVVEQPASRDHRRHLALSRNNLALAQSRAGRTDEALAAYADAIRLQQRLSSEDPQDERIRRDLALSHNNLGLLQSQIDRADQAETSFAEAIRLQQQLVDVEPDNAEDLRLLAASHNNLGAVYNQSQPARAVESYTRALAYQQRASAAQPDSSRHQGDVALTHNNLGAAFSRQGQNAKAAESYGQAIQIQRRLVAVAPTRKTFRSDLAVSCNNLGLVQSRLRQTSEAKRSFEESRQLQHLLIEQHPNDLELRSSLGGVYNNLGIVFEEQGRDKEAAEAYRLAIEQQRVAFTQAPAVSRYRTFLSKHFFNYGRVLRQLGQPDQAAQIALARRDLWPHDGERLFHVAEELALTGQLLADSPAGDLSCDECMAKAIETLKQAQAAGWKFPADWQQHENLAFLKQHAVFADFIAQAASVKP